MEVNNENLDKLSNDIYKKYFYEADEDHEGNLIETTSGAIKVLEQLKNINNNPKLLEYVLRCLEKYEIFTIPHKFYYIEVIKDYYDSYLPLRELQIKKGKPKFTKKIIINKIFKNITELEEYALNYNNNCNNMFEKYEIKII